MTRNDQLEKLHKIIEAEVFITKEQERIISSRGTESKWLFDFRKILLDSHHLNLVSELFWETYKDKLPFQVAGLEVASLPLCCLGIVMKSVERGNPVNGFYIRKSRKKDGLLHMIEGKVTDEPIILVDDIINSGKSFLRQLAVMDELNKQVKDIFVILRFRDTPYYKFANERNIEITSLFSLPDFGHKLHIDKSRKLNYDQFVTKWYFRSKGANFHYVVPKSAPVIDSDRVYFGSDTGNFWALNQNDGSVAWKYKVGWHAKGKSIFSTPAVYRNTVFFGSYDGNVYALDTKTGKRRWIFMEADWVGSSPCIAEDLGLLFIGLEFGLFSKQGGIAGVRCNYGRKKMGVLNA